MQVGPECGTGIALGSAPLRRSNPACFSPPAIRILDGPTGRELMTIRLGARFARRFGEPYQVIHRADLLTGLLTAVGAEPAISIETSAQLSEVRQDRGVRGDRDRRRPNLHASALIGADGIRSTVRSHLSRTRHRCYRGYAIYRALIPVDAMPSELLDEAVCLWLCPGGHVVHYPVRAGRA